MNNGPSRVAIIGPYPPRIGGIAVHIQRLQTVLTGTHDAWVFDPYGSASQISAPKVLACGPPGVLAGIRLLSGVHRFNPDVIHLHVASMRRLVTGGRMLLSLLPRRTGRVLTIHTGNFVSDYREASKGIQHRMRDLVRWFDIVIAVSDEIAASVNRVAAQTQHISVLPAFIPPTGSVMQDPPPWLTEYRAAGRKVVLCAGYGIPDYGFDCLLDAVASDPDLQAQCLIVLCLYGQRDPAYVQSLQMRVRKITAAKVLEDLPPSQFTSLLAASDIFVRPTLFDGDAVTIREAGYFGKQVIASDCTKRPPGVEVFRTANAHDLTSLLHRAIHEPSFALLSEGWSSSVSRYTNLYDLARSTARRRA